jgi:dTDP-alpha-D-glucose dehydrogenase
MRFLNNPEQVTVAVIGFGYVGACVAATLADRGVRVVGVDTDAELIAELSGGRCPIQESGLAELIGRGMRSGSLRLTTDAAEAADADVVLITVGTPVREDGSLADEQLRAACGKLGTHLRPGQLVVLKSTVPPGVTRDVVLPLLERGGLTAGADFGLAFTPERLAEGTALHELSTLPIVAGGLDADSTRDVTEFWRHALGVQVITVDSLEAAEVVKLAGNWWIDLNIAMANELAKYCAGYGVDVLDVISAANTIPKGVGNVNILLPSVGVGGSCLTKDPWMVWRSAEQNGVQIRTAPVGREVNSGMPEYTAQLAIDELIRQGKNPASAKVAVLGLAFKNDTSDLRATPTLGMVRMLAKTGAKISLYDPLADVGSVEQLFRIRPSDTLLDAVRDADCVAVLALHRQLRDIDFAELPVAESCVLLDGRAYYSKEKIAELRAAGYVYRGVGRGSAIGGPRTTERV